MADISNPIFHDEALAMAHLEASRWPNGPFCPYCKSTNVHRMGGKTQAGMFLCNGCREKFTARVGSVMERSHIPVHKWLLAIHLMSASKKGMSSKQLQRMLGISYKSAWFLSMRIREAMSPAPVKDVGPIGGAGKTVEADETFVGGIEGVDGSDRRPLNEGSQGDAPSESPTLLELRCLRPRASALRAHLLFT